MDPDPDDKPAGPVKEYTAWLASSLSGYEALAKTLVQHRAEKGRIVESVVKGALRSILPGRFSIGTGFVITSSGRSSSQIDLVLYDAIYNSPILLEGGTGLFPIESVYGTVEVKSVLDGNQIDEVAKSIAIIRDFAREKRYAVYGNHDLGGGRIIVSETEVERTLPPRAFVFAISSPYGNIHKLEGALKIAAPRAGAHIHGLAVLEKNWFLGQRAYREQIEFNLREDRALDAFCATVLANIQSMAMGPASMKPYLGLKV
jgi:Domain of unknown function (DUF6602)